MKLTPAEKHQLTLRLLNNEAGRQFLDLLEADILDKLETIEMRWNSAQYQSDRVLYAEIGRLNLVRILKKTIDDPTNSRGVDIDELNEGFSND